ncbi:MAG: M24 family metallopeptidase C-terminal domain-containing protein [Lachnospiraceae bacterium]
MPGIALDLAAREPFWERGLDYRCGTSHGVGFVGTVHEGPRALNGRCQVPFVPGMTVTDEPGIYETDKIGIRIENELLCKEAMETEYGKFYCFEPITYRPIDRKAIDPKKLSPAELSWLNQYHATVYETLSPILPTARTSG